MVDSPDDRSAPGQSHADAPESESSGSEFSSLGEASNWVGSNWSGLGIQFGAAIIVFALVGNWLDGRWGTRPLLLILGVLLGFFGGTIALVRAVRPGRGAFEGENDSKTKH